jgi:UMF1 family MFS transporter
MRNNRYSPPARREIFGWAMFDFANSSYTTIIVTVAFSVYFTTLVAPGGRGDFLWGIALTLSNVAIILTAPILGAIADGAGRKKQFLAGTWLLCVVATAALYLVGPGDVGLALALFVASNLGYALGETLSSAFLPEISTPDNVGRISGLGWGLGYLGGLGSLLLARPLLAGGFVVDNVDNLRKVWLLTAAFFLLAALPTFLLLKERAPRPPRASPGRLARRGLRRMAATVRDFRSFTELARFLGVYFLYACGLMTVISFSGVFASKTLEFSGNELIVLFLLLQITSSAGALIGGLLQDRFGSRDTIRLILVVWIGVCVAVYLAQTKSAFWAAALVAGLALGSLMASSRALVGLLSPVGKSGELFGFWGLTMRAAYAVGPAIFGGISAAVGSQRVAVLSTVGWFVLGLAGMQRIDEERGLKQAESWIDPDPLGDERRPETSRKD